MGKSPDDHLSCYKFPIISLVPHHYVVIVIKSGKKGIEFFVVIRNWRDHVLQRGPGSLPSLYLITMECYECCSNKNKEHFFHKNINLSLLWASKRDEFQANILVVNKRSALYYYSILNNVIYSAVIYMFHRYYYYCCCCFFLNRESLQKYIMSFQRVWCIFLYMCVRQCNSIGHELMKGKTHITKGASSKNCHTLFLFVFFLLTLYIAQCITEQ